MFLKHPTLMGYITFSTLQRVILSLIATYIKYISLVSVLQIIKHDQYFIHLLEANGLVHSILVIENHLTPYCCFAFITFLHTMTHIRFPYTDHQYNIKCSNENHIIYNWYTCDKVVCVNSQVPGGQQKSLLNIIRTWCQVAE